MDGLRHVAHHAGEIGHGLRFTQQWTGCGRVDEGVLVRLVAALPPDHVVLLAATVGQADFTSRFNVVFGVELP